MAYFDNLRNIYQETRAKYAELQNERETAAVALDKASKDPGMSRAKKMMYREHNAEVQQEFSGKLEKLTSDMERRISSVRREYASHLDGIYLASPDKLDAEAVALMNTGIMTAKELSALADKHQSNPVMQRVIASYAEKLDGTEAHLLSVQLRSVGDGSHELGIFDALTEWCRKGVQPIREVADNIDKRFDGVYASAIDQL